MRFTDSNLDTYEVKRDNARDVNLIARATDFFAVGPLIEEESFQPIAFLSAPTLGQPCIWKILDKDSVNGDGIETERVFETQPLVHIEF